MRGPAQADRSLSAPAGAEPEIRRDGPDGGVVRGQVQVGLHRHVLTDLNPRAAALLDHLLRERCHLGRVQSARSSSVIETERTLAVAVLCVEAAKTGARRLDARRSWIECRIDSVLCGKSWRTRAAATRNRRASLRRRSFAQRKEKGQTVNKQNTASPAQATAICATPNFFLRGGGSSALGPRLCPQRGPAAGRYCPCPSTPQDTDGLRRSLAIIRGLRVDPGAARWWKGARAGQRVDRRGSYASVGPGWKIQEVSRVGAQGVTSKSKLLAREIPRVCKNIVGRFRGGINGRRVAAAPLRRCRRQSRCVGELLPWWPPGPGRVVSQQRSRVVSGRWQGRFAGRGRCISLAS